MYNFVNNLKILTRKCANGVAACGAHSTQITKTFIQMNQDTENKKEFNVTIKGDQKEKNLQVQLVVERSLKKLLEYTNSTIN